jgi:hypothetical protein
MTMLLDRIQAAKKKIANPSTSAEAEAVAADDPVKAEVPLQVTKLKNIANELGCNVTSCDYDLNLCAIGISVTGYEVGITLTTSVTTDGLVVARVDEEVLEGIPIADPDAASLLADNIAATLVRIPVLTEAPIEVLPEISAEARAEMEARADELTQEITEAVSQQLAEMPAATDLNDKGKDGEEKDGEEKDGEEKDGEEKDDEKFVKAPPFGRKKS